MFRPICPPAFFRCLSNTGTFTELRTTSFIESTGVACSDSVSHNQVQVLSIPVLLFACSQDWTCNFQMIAVGLFCRDAVGVFYNPSQLGWRVENIPVGRRKGIRWVWIANKRTKHEQNYYVDNLAASSIKSRFFSVFCSFIFFLLLIVFISNLHFYKCCLTKF